MTVYEQLKTYCDCLDVTEGDIDELIDSVSMATCWCLSPCETFLKSERVEMFPLPDCQNRCSTFEFEPYYQPFDLESFKFEFVEIAGIEEDSEEITEYGYIESKNVFRVELPLELCECGLVCGCVPEYYLKVTYTAGYDEIPECLLPAFCEALKYIMERRKCCECEKCQDCTDEDRTEVFITDAANLKDQLKIYFVNLLTEQYKKQLALISLCDLKWSIWGFAL